MDVGPIWLDDLHCVSSDTDLTQCKHNGIGVNNCINREDIILSCLTGEVDTGSYLILYMTRVNKIIIRK